MTRQYPLIHIYHDQTGFFYFSFKVINGEKKHCKTAFNLENRLERFDVFLDKYSQLFGNCENHIIKYSNAANIKLNGVLFADFAPFPQPINLVDNNNNI